MKTILHCIYYIILELLIIYAYLIDFHNKHKLYSILILPSYMPMGTLASR